MPAPTGIATDATARVLLHVPTPLALTKARAAARESRYVVDVPAEGVLLLEGVPGDWAILLNALERDFAPVEADEIRIAPIGGLPRDGLDVALASLKARSLPSLLGESRSIWLPRALEEHRLTSYFQPIVDVAEGTVFAHEALLRATREDGCVVDAGTIVEAGRRLGALHTLDQVGRTAAIHRAHRLSMGTLLFINFFPSVVYDVAHCLRPTLQAMRETGIRPEQIVFEVVESEAISDPQYLLDILTYYRASGFRVALDDLGSGYSSLNMLAVLRPDFVKMDMELAREAATDPLRGALVEAVVRTAHEYDIQVIAEGVETVESACLLANLGVRLLQGHLFGRPAPTLGTASPEIISRLKARQRTA